MKTKTFLLLIMLTSCFALSAKNFFQEDVFSFYEYAVMDSVLFLGLEDINNDGHLDLIYIPVEKYLDFINHNSETREYIKIQYGDGTLHGLINSENYDFIRLPDYGVIFPHGSYNCETDINNDGIKDFLAVFFRNIIVNYDWHNPDDFSSAVLGHGDNSNITSYFTRNRDLYIAQGRQDFNGDGIDDLLILPKVTYQMFDGPVFIPSTFIYFGGDNFDIHNPVVELKSIASSYNSNTVINRGTCLVGDFDGDGIDDLVVTVEFNQDFLNNNPYELEFNTLRVYWGGENFGEIFTDIAMPENFRDYFFRMTRSTDINNNGRADIRTNFRSPYSNYIISFDEERNFSIYTSDDFNGELPYCFIDINGDGLNDSLFPYDGYARLGQHNLNTINFSDTIYPLAGFPTEALFGYPDQYIAIPGLSDTNHDVLMTVRHRSNSLSERWMMFYVSEGIVSISNDLIPEAVSSLKVSMYPTPFADKVSINIESKFHSPKTISIHNIKGQKIREFSDINSKLINWDGNDLDGKSVSSGIYFVRVKQDNQQKIKKLIKIK